jgi:hypothetical protein
MKLLTTLARKLIRTLRLFAVLLHVPTANTNAHMKVTNVTLPWFADGSDNVGQKLGGTLRLRAE